MAEFENAGIRLKTARMAAGFKSAKEFCDKHSIPSSTYSLHETGGRSIKPKTAEKYADLLGVSAAWLLTGAGSPYKGELSDASTPVTHEEFMELLKYHGNDKIQKTLQYENESLNNVNPLVLCKIIIGMIDTLRHLDFSIDESQLSKKAVEIYKDIVKASSQPEDQLTMINLSITTFERQIQEILDQDQKKVANE